jgi:hypothetical protein
MTLRLASTSALRATADKLLAQGRALRLATLAQGRARLAVLVAFTAAFVAILGDAPVLACPVCFGAEETSMIDGAKLGVLVMLAITLAVQGGFVGFFLYLRRRAKRIAEIDLDAEWSDLQRARTS